MKILNMALLAFLVTNCGSTQDETSTNSSADVKNAIPDVGTIMIDLPSSVAPTSSSLRLADGEGVESEGLKTFCASNSSNELCTIAGQASAWANPIYMDSTGYVGNENSNKPTDSNYAPLIEALATIDIYTPTAFKAFEKPTMPEAVSSVE